MIICSCTLVSDHDIEIALVEIMSQANAPLPTPGVVYRHMSKKMNCCSCAPLAVTTIYAIMEKLERQGRICPYACATAKSRLIRLDQRRAQRRAAARTFVLDAAE